MSWFQRALFSRLERREQSAFNALYRKQAPRLFRRLVTMGHTQPIIEEAIHEAFLVYWDKFHAPVLRGEEMVEPLEAPYSWLLRVAQNKVIDAHRKASTAQQYKSHAEHILCDRSATQEESFARRDMLQQVLEKLEPRDVELLLLREGEGLSYDELAQELSLERSSVGTLLRRARQAFQKAHQELLSAYAERQS